MEETRVIQRVGSYSTGQAERNDCKKCRDAVWGTVIIDGLCLDCLLAVQKRALELACERIADSDQKYHEATTGDEWVKRFMEEAQNERTSKNP